VDERHDLVGIRGGHCREDATGRRAMRATAVTVGAHLPMTLP
jgi:hypothetical protein